MSSSETCIFVPGEAIHKIAGSSLSGGTLVLQFSQADEIFVVAAVEIGHDIRSSTLPSRDYLALNGVNASFDGQWLRAPEPGDATSLHLQHLLLARRPLAAIPIDVFRDLVAGVRDPGNKRGFLITHDPQLPPELRDLGCPEFAGWTIERTGVRPLPLQIEPECFGIEQLAATWPVERMSTIRVLLVGCGSIGSAAAEALASVGMGTIDLVDPDRFLWHNMIRHSLAKESVGRFKVDAMREHLRERWPHTTVHPHREDVVEDAHTVRQLFKEADVVICAADGIAPRRVVSHLARRAGVPSVLACVLEHGAVGELLRLRPTPRFGCLLCMRAALANEGAMDAEADQELGYGTGSTHQPMSAVPPDLRLIGTLAAKVAVATVLESRHGDHTQRLPGEHAIIGLRPAGDLAPPFDVSFAGEIRWSTIPSPRPTCPTCSPP
ncbi:HesA/MoeB/ThiF family protein [Agrococcus beijingensis]|uniref:HesA/MoeB/ThiF family protein n=1 Tax=Agrococcus beijingensis TaxID=3068634 RepID=UPI0027411ACC|nr:ThiF family adenylyltransferase [Agrococcus sp. REN33]